MADIVAARCEIDAAEGFELLAEEYEQSVKEGTSTWEYPEEHRILFEGIPCWPGLRNLFEPLKQNGVNVTAVVYAPAFGFQYTTVREMAAAYCKAPCSVCIEDGVEWRETMAKENGVSGALVNYNRSCKPWSGAMPEIERRWREDLDIPVVHFENIAENGREQIDKYLDQGKKVVGVFPYYAPEEIIYAGGLVPFGVWGGQGPIDKAKEYFPTFYYSLALRCLEMGLDGSLDGLSATMITTLDDTLRPLSQNYKVSVGREIPMVFLNHAQHRKEDFGKTYNAKIFKQAAERLEEICDVKITDENLKKAFEVYNENRALKRYINRRSIHGTC